MKNIIFTLQKIFDLQIIHHDVAEINSDDINKTLYLII